MYHLRFGNVHQDPPNCTNNLWFVTW